MSVVKNAMAWVKKADTLVFKFPKLFLTIIALLTVFFGYKGMSVQMYSDFADLLPQEHPYIELHNDIRNTFGGANNVVLALVVEEGTVFTKETLARLHRITQAVDSVSGVNHNLVSSLTHRTSRKVWLTETGDINSQPYYDPLKPDMTSAQLQQLGEDVKANPRVYGLLVSPNLKAALIKAQFNEGQLDYAKIFGELQEIRETETVAGITIYATGQPMLWGWVYSYLDQIFLIFATTLAIMLLLLLGYFRSFYGVLLPLFGISVSAIWGMGIVSLLDYNLDPLTLVIPFLISARAMSHAIQLVQRFYFELEKDGHSLNSAHRTFDTLFRPGALGIVSDAIGLSLIALGSVPINVKLGIYASIWAGCVVITVLVAVPLVLSLLPKPKPLREEHGLDKKAFDFIGKFISNLSGARTVLFSAVFLFLTATYFSRLAWRKTKMRFR